MCMIERDECKQTNSEQIANQERTSKMRDICQYFGCPKLAYPIFLIWGIFGQSLPAYNFLQANFGQYPNEHFHQLYYI